MITHKDILEETHQVIEDLRLIEIAVLGGGYLALIGTSGLLVNSTLSRISKEPIIISFIQYSLYSRFDER